MPIRLSQIGGTTMSEALGGFFSDAVTILEPTGSQDAYGEVINSWTALAGHCDLVCMVAGGDVSVRMKKQEFRTSQAVYEVELRRVLLQGYYPGIDQQHRARFDGKDWAIVSVVHDVTHTWTELSCESIEPGAI